MLAICLLNFNISIQYGARDTLCLTYFLNNEDYNLCINIYMYKDDAKVYHPISVLRLTLSADFFELQKHGREAFFLPILTFF